MSEINNLASRSQELQKRMRSSLDNLVDGCDSEAIITFPDDNNNIDAHVNNSGDDIAECIPGNIVQSSDTVKFEQKRMLNTSKSKILTNGFSREQVRLTI